MTLLGQHTVEVFGGGSYNDLFERGEFTGHYLSEYKNGNGFVIGGAIEEIKTDWIKWRFTFHFEKYNGEFTNRDGGQGGSYAYTAKFSKSTIALGLYPINIMATKNLLINFGIILSRMVDENLEGTNYGWGINTFYWSRPLNENTRYSHRGMIGFQTRITYQIKLSEKLALLPQYHFYYGMSREFKISGARAMRHYFNIGISKAINFRKNEGE
ncbi:MAG: hypothetical protein CO022_00130 [Flavobacteriales bacterium CG_4_9_14_0_2_um_filter_32_27]|nr:MAG: hypothetical protein CO022_00130 [Flavobacteriales bacterium CG_4_9_14_0_2_um_filter_32_27]